MKKEYLTPEFDLTVFSFESLLTGTTQPYDVSTNEVGGDDHKDDDTGQW